MEEHDEPGSLIGVVLASLVERVTALEEKRRPRIRPIVLEGDAPLLVGRQLIIDQVARLYRDQLPLSHIAEVTGFNVKTVRSYLRKAGLVGPVAKKETS